MSKIQDRPIPSPEILGGSVSTPLLNWLRDYTRTMFAFISDVRNLQNAGKQSILHLDELTAEPAAPRDGMIVYANGTNWNPGGGEGAYVRAAGAWVKLH